MRTVAIASLVYLVNAVEHLHCCYGSENGDECYIPLNAGTLARSYDPNQWQTWEEVKYKFVSHPENDALMRMSWKRRSKCCWTTACCHKTAFGDRVAHATLECAKRPLAEGEHGVPHHVDCDTGRKRWNGRRLFDWSDWKRHIEKSKQKARESASAPSSDDIFCEGDLCVTYAICDDEVEAFWRDKKGWLQKVAGVALISVGVVAGVTCEAATLGACTPVLLASAAMLAATNVVLTEKQLHDMAEDHNQGFEVAHQLGVPYTHRGHGRHLTAVAAAEDQVTRGTGHLNKISERTMQDEMWPFVLSQINYTMGELFPGFELNAEEHAEVHRIATLVHQVARTRPQSDVQKILDYSYSSHEIESMFRLNYQGLAGKAAWRTKKGLGPDFWACRLGTYNTDIEARNACETDANCAYIYATYGWPVLVLRSGTYTKGYWYTIASRCNSCPVEATAFQQDLIQYQTNVKAKSQFFANGECNRRTGRRAEADDQTEQDMASATSTDSILLEEGLLRSILNNSELPKVVTILDKLDSLDSVDRLALEMEIHGFESTPEEATLIYEDMIKLGAVNNTIQE